MVCVPVLILRMRCTMSGGYVWVVATLVVVVLCIIRMLMVCMWIGWIVLRVWVVTGLRRWRGLCCCCEVVERIVVHFGLG